ncbi:hypothetical protein ACJZ2D_008330 [Fusarium nematophilum]
MAALPSVRTRGGHVHGTIYPQTPDVQQFLNIPYAQPPVGRLRFSPPRPSKPFERLYATSTGSSCMQYLSSAASIYTRDVLEFNIQGANGTGTISEDCLTLSVWAPIRKKSRASKFPVFVWIHRGGLQWGGRLNIFGFPNAEGLEHQNLRLLDQRLAIEWAQDNIAAFGGDPARITLFGESAGATASGYYSYAYPWVPIVRGFIAQSGTEVMGIQQQLAVSNFTFVAENVGCGGLAPRKSLSFWKTPQIGFRSVVDDKIVFSNYTTRAEAGQGAKIPAIIGTNENEGVNFPYDTDQGPDPVLSRASLIDTWVCPARASSENRLLAGIETWRYEYRGNFTNISLRPWMGAYRESEIPMIFGTHRLFRGNSIPLEYETSHAMQDAWLAFAADGPAGLESTGWPVYDEGGRDALIFGHGTAVYAGNISSLEAGFLMWGLEETSRSWRLWLIFCVLLGLIANFVALLGCLSTATKPINLFKIRRDDLINAVANVTGQSNGTFSNEALPKAWYWGLSGVCDSNLHCTRAFPPTLSLGDMVESSLRHTLHDNKTALNSALSPWRAAIKKFSIDGSSPTISPRLHTDRALFLSSFRGSAALAILSLLVGVAILVVALVSLQSRRGEPQKKPGLWVLYLATALDGLLFLGADALVVHAMVRGPYSIVTYAGGQLFPDTLVGRGMVVFSAGVIFKFLAIGGVFVACVAFCVVSFVVSWFALLMESIKLMLMGAGGVGKTTIKIQALYPQFLDIDDPTLEDSYRKQVNVDGETCVLEVLETVDGEYPALVDGWIQLADAYILSYSLTDRLTFNEIRASHARIESVREKSAPEWLPKASINAWKSGPIVLVANKADLVEGRQVWTHEGRDMAKELGVPFVELTARNTGEVDILIADTVRMVKEYRLQLNQGNLGQEISASKHPWNSIQSHYRSYHRSASLLFKCFLKKAKTSTSQEDAKSDSTNIMK